MAAPLPAAQRVFAITELLEEILLNVTSPTKEPEELEREELFETLLFSQRVNRTFKATIEGSEKLQRELWFRPKTADSPKERINPLASGIGRRCDRIPFLRMTNRLPPSRHVKPFDQIHIFELVPPRESDRGGSWKDMYVVRPMANTRNCKIGIMYDMWDRTREVQLCVLKDVTASGGLTAGDLLLKIKSAVDTRITECCKDFSWWNGCEEHQKDREALKVLERWEKLL